MIVHPYRSPPLTSWGAGYRSGELRGSTPRQCTHSPLELRDGRHR